MPVAAAQGTFQNSGYTIPEVWSKKLNIEFYDASTLAAIANTNYEGEIRDVGDKVWIRGLPTITTFIAPKNAQLPVQIPETPKTQLTVDYRRGFNYFIDDIDKAQSDYNLFDEWTSHGGEVLTRDCEKTDIYPNLIAKGSTALRGNAAGKYSQNIRFGALGAAANHVGLTQAASGTANRRNILDFLVDCRLALTENSIPRQGQEWVVLPAWAVALLRKSDLKDASNTGDDTSVLRTGRHGTIDGLEIYESNMLYSATDSANVVWYAYFGHKSALTYAAKLVKPRMIESEIYPGHFARAFMVHGFEVIKDQGFGVAIVRPAIVADT